MQTILITGGAGMIGKALTTHLIDKGYYVIVLTRQFSQKKRICFLECEETNY